MMKKSVYKILLLPGGSFAAITAVIIGLIIYIPKFHRYLLNQDETTKKNLRQEN
jgi:hypothetical protein